MSRFDTMTGVDSMTGDSGVSMPSGVDSMTGGNSMTSEWRSFALSSTIWLIFSGIKECEPC